MFFPLPEGGLEEDERDISNAIKYYKPRGQPPTAQGISDSLCPAPISE
jgi:hypothetical protein